MRYCKDWNPEERPSALRNAEYSNGVMVDSTSHTEISCVWVREIRASIFSAGSRSSRRTHSSAAVSSCSIRRIHSSDTWCTMMNSISLCSLDSGFCAASSLSSCRYSP